MDYLITFFTHFGAVKLCRRLKREGIAHDMMPVPRSVSSNCGTCVRLAYDDADPAQFLSEDAEALYRVEPGHYVLLQDHSC
ncbi:MAG: DUF3343 domain-containing protein [Chloroflexia bacterium]|nr:DUF3343 domain-containing protein [Chloroflexia bacterium]